MSRVNSTLICLDYNGLVCEFNETGWFNATAAAAHYGKRPVDWLSLDSTKEYVSALLRHLNQSEESSLWQARRGGNQRTNTRNSGNGGTWFHPKLAVPFARWLNVDFAIWCDLQIDALVRGQHPHFDWKQQRLTGKVARREVTDAQQRFVEYAKENGSQNADKYWANFVRMTNAELGIPQVKDIRDQLDVRQLTNLGTAEYIEASVIDEGVLAGMDYHDIFQMAKHRVKDLARLLSKQVTA